MAGGLGEEARQPRISETHIGRLGLPWGAPGHGRAPAVVCRLGEGLSSRGAISAPRSFPHTPHKFFLQAPLETRVRRRLQQLEASGQTNLSEDELIREVRERDVRDSTRAESPLTMDASYEVIDTGSRSIDEVVEAILGEIRQNR